MKSYLDLDQPVARELRRIAIHRLTAAADLLEHQPDGPDRAVHQARRHIKRCRALYRLVASGARSFQKAENTRLGDIGRELSGLRDATAMIEATAYLKQAVPSRSNAMLMDRLAKRLDQNRMDTMRDADATAETLRSATAGLLSAVQAAAAFEWPHAASKQAKCLGRGWEKTALKAQPILAMESGSDDEFHSLRKRAQDRWMHALLLRQLWPAAMIATQRRAKLLADWLGHAQDLAVLRDAIALSPELAADAVEREAIADIIRTQQARLHQDCRKIGTELFAPSRQRDRKTIAHLFLLQQSSRE